MLCCASFVASSLARFHYCSTQIQRSRSGFRFLQAKKKDPRNIGTSTEPQVFKKDFRRATNHKFVCRAWKSLLTTGETAEEVLSVCLSGASENGLTCMPILGYVLALTYHTRLIELNSSTVFSQCCVPGAGCFCLYPTI